MSHHQQTSWKCRLKLLTAQGDVLSEAVVAQRPWTVERKKFAVYFLTHSVGGKGMVRKNRRRTSDWENGMAMVPLKTRESEDVLL